MIFCLSGTNKAILYVDSIEKKKLLSSVEEAGLLTALEKVDSC